MKRNGDPGGYSVESQVKPGSPHLAGRSGVTRQAWNYLVRRQVKPGSPYMTLKVLVGAWEDAVHLATDLVRADYAGTDALQVLWPQAFPPVSEIVCVEIRRVNPLPGQPYLVARLQPEEAVHV